MEYVYVQVKVVYCDLKSANLMIDGQGWLKVIDFGIVASMSDTVFWVSN
jgi:Protein kinase domain.